MKEMSLQTNPECQCHCHIIFIRRRLYRLPPMHRLRKAPRLRLASPPALKRAPGHLLTTLLGTSSKIRQEEIILLWLSGCLLGIFFMFVAVN